MNGVSQRSRLLYDKWVLDVPKLLDLAAIYGPDNPALVQQLMQQVHASARISAMPYCYKSYTTIADGCMPYVVAVPPQGASHSLPPDATIGTIIKACSLLFSQTCHKDTMSTSNEPLGASCM